jgi:hypothetical protein
VNVIHTSPEDSPNALWREPPTISGEPAVGQALQCARRLLGPGVHAKVSWQWLRGPTNGSAPYELDRWEEIAGAVGQTYTPTDDDAGRRLAVHAVAHARSREEGIRSQPTAPVGPRRESPPHQPTDPVRPSRSL